VINVSKGNKSNDTNSGTTKGEAESTKSTTKAKKGDTQKADKEGPDEAAKEKDGKKG